MDKILTATEVLERRKNFKLSPEREAVYAKEQAALLQPFIDELRKIIRQYDEEYEDD